MVEGFGLLLGPAVLELAGSGALRLHSSLLLLSISSYPGQEEESSTNTELSRLVSKRNRISSGLSF